MSFISVLDLKKIFYLRRETKNSERKSYLLNMSIGLASIKQVVGLRQKVSNCIAYQDEQTIIYPAGANVIVYNLDQKTQRFIPNTDKAVALNTICVSLNRRYVAIAEKLIDRPIVSVYDLHTLRKRKQLNFPSNDQIHANTEIISMSFSPDSKHLITQTTAPDWSIYYWSWEKSKIMASYKVIQQQNSGNQSSVSQVSFNPQDNSQICVVGNGIFKMFRYADGILKNYLSLKQEAHNFTSHAWLTEDKVIVGNNRAELFLIQNCEISNEYKLYEIRDKERRVSTSSTHSSTIPPPSANQLGVLDSNKQTGNDSHDVTSIISYSKGFIVSCGKGRAFLYEKIDDKDQYRKLRELRVPADQNSNDPSKSEEQYILSMSISPSEETLLAVTSWQQIYQFVFSNIDVGKV